MRKKISQIRLWGKEIILYVYVAPCLKINTHQIFLIESFIMTRNDKFFFFFCNTKYKVPTIYLFIYFLIFYWKLFGASFSTQRINNSFTTVFFLHFKKVHWKWQNWVKLILKIIKYYSFFVELITSFTLVSPNSFIRFAYTIVKRSCLL